MKKYKILTQSSKGGKTEDHDYTAVVNKNTTLLKYSKNAWLDDIKGTVAATLENSGNGITIKIEDVTGDMTLDITSEITLDYTQAYQLLCLLQIDNLGWKNKIKQSGKTIKRF